MDVADVGDIWEGNGYFAGLRMTVAKCIILNNDVAV